MSEQFKANPQIGRHILAPYITNAVVVRNRRAALQGGLHGRLPNLKQDLLRRRVVHPEKASTEQQLRWLAEGRWRAPIRWLARG